MVKGRHRLISAFPMSARVIHKMGLKEVPQNFLLMHAVGLTCQTRSPRLSPAARSWPSSPSQEEKPMSIIDTAAFLETLPIMGRSMAAIFIVMIVILLCIKGLGKIFPSNPP